MKPPKFTKRIAFFLLTLAGVANSFAESFITAGPWTGAVTHTSAVVKVSLSAKVSATALLVATQANWRDARRFQAMLTLSHGSVAGFAVNGLKPDTRYYYAVESGGEVDRVRGGEFRTFPAGPASFRFAFGACANTGSSNAVFTTIRDHSPLFFMNTGDFHYEDIMENDPEPFRATYLRVLGSPTQGDLYRHVPFVYMWDDHDYAGNDSHAGSTARPAARQTYQEWVPHYPLAAGAGDVPIYQTFVVGRVKFILSDLRSERSPASQRDDAAKTMLGDQQKAWLKAELLAAQGKQPLIFWVSSVPWISAAPKGKGTPDFWGSYATERREMADFIKEHNIRGLCVLAGDAHMLAADDGTHSDYATGGGAPLPVLQAASLDRKASFKGGPYSQGSYLPVAGEGCFGLVTVEDQGEQIRVAFSGRNHLNEEKIKLNFTVPVLSSQISPNTTHK
jgi:phosphodiesterase/alkaline phosphatase D-like protein